MSTSRRENIVLGTRASGMRTRADGSNKRWIAFARTKAMDQVGDTLRRLNQEHSGGIFASSPPIKGLILRRLPIA
jgi:hypothetical protein